MIDKLYSFLGLAAKARKLVSGESACERAIKIEKAKLVITAADASDNTRKKFTNLCSFRKTDLRIFGKKEYIGRYIGKGICSVVVILEKSFAEKLKEMIDSVVSECGGEKVGEN